MAEDIGVHQVERLVEMLTSRDCEKLLIALSRPAEDIFQRIDRLSLENNRLNSRAKRDAGWFTGHLRPLTPLKIVDGFFFSGGAILFPCGVT